MSTWSNYTERWSPLNNPPLNSTPNKPRIIVTIKVDPKKKKRTQKKAHLLPTDEPSA